MHPHPLSEEEGLWSKEFYFVHDGQFSGDPAACQIWGGGGLDYQTNANAELYAMGGRNDRILCDHETTMPLTGMIVQGASVCSRGRDAPAHRQHYQGQGSRVSFVGDSLIPKD